MRLNERFVFPLNNAVEIKSDDGYGSKMFLGGKVSDNNIKFS